MAAESTSCGVKLFGFRALRGRTDYERACPPFTVIPAVHGGFPKLGVLIGVSNNKDYSILESTLGPPI